MSKIILSKWGESERGTVSVELLRLCVALIDALGFEAKVYKKDGKRVADMYKHKNGFDLPSAFTTGHNLRTLLMNLLKSLGENDPNNKKPEGDKDE